MLCAAPCCCSHSFCRSFCCSSCCCISATSFAFCQQAVAHGSAGKARSGARWLASSRAPPADGQQEEQSHSHCCHQHCTVPGGSLQRGCVWGSRMRQPGQKQCASEGFKSVSVSVREPSWPSMVCTLMSLLSWQLTERNSFTAGCVLCSIFSHKIGRRCCWGTSAAAAACYSLHNEHTHCNPSKGARPRG